MQAIRPSQQLFKFNSQGRHIGLYADGLPGHGASRPPLMQILCGAGAKVIAASQLGRPNGECKPEDSLKPAAP